ncbi:amino acid ABC transporter permease [Smaragdicoccus niigatensis]|uniref:amino acid ABC transporter permease n=1 Tax=Smaragdicoccus niigatensis TaxID=359359 RepID=UPI0003605EDA|nr:amino acid ABC transporter permease [Smaragdicoccus niigatensis]
MDLISTYGADILKAFGTTLELTVYSAIASLVFGTVLAGLRVCPIPVARAAVTVYITIFRNTPLTLIILFCSFGLYQSMGVKLAASNSPTFLVDNNFRLAVLGLSVYTSAFVCESIRAGINTVPLGQAEAGRSLGLTFTQNLRLIVLPQAFRAVVAPLGSVLSALTRNTTISSVIGVAEAALLMKTMIENEAALLTIGGIFALGFLALTLPIGLLSGYLGKRLEVVR